MRLTKRTNISMRVLMYCAVNPGRLVTKSEIAETCNISENHLAQVINKLGQMGFLQTQRGRNGGMMLGRPAGAISVGEVFRATEASVPIAECFAGVDENTCPLRGVCRLRDVIGCATEAFYRALDKVTLEELVAENSGLAEIMVPMAQSA
ncbi:Rrf2 family transcriptional regulator [Pseudooceanicola sp. CBS1P-1]|uniref:Rrf2 family transcriptional regulator n=1 Tax=Pseudooceanicola albus TaxID=2692189 RepID=A0A6L7G6U5_9RHOB|nr:MULTISPECIES: Rrf2 family transcriptional regulator [Pseudooceanicola]MBT9384682.1 Rrf2 family transcriptional regulator [Pseudooceanicola endophyticus]MXN18383.1 Rrf2 family transcriptional regulator [Pseudooceanicola albus]